MRTLSELKKHCAEMSAQYPELKSRIWGYYDLAVSEISEGDPEFSEVQKAVSDIEGEIKEYLNPSPPEPPRPKKKETNTYVIWTRERRPETRLEQGAYIVAETTPEEIMQDFFGRNPELKGLDILINVRKAHMPKCTDIKETKVIIPLPQYIY